MEWEEEFAVVVVVRSGIEETNNKKHSSDARRTAAQHFNEPSKARTLPHRAHGFQLSTYVSAKSSRRTAAACSALPPLWHSG